METITRCHTSRGGSKHNIDKVIEGGHRVNVRNSIKSNREVLARFLEQLRPDRGWWYRVPEFSTSVDYNDEKSTIIDTDAIMPHFGTLFGLTEPASAIALIEMGCLKMIKDKTVIVRQGFDKLASEFSVKPLLEVESTRIGNKRQYFIRIGTPPSNLPYPKVIYDEY